MSTKIKTPDGWKTVFDKKVKGVDGITKLEQVYYYKFTTFPEYQNTWIEHQYNITNVIKGNEYIGRGNYSTGDNNQASIIAVQDVEIITNGGTILNTPLSCLFRVTGDNPIIKTRWFHVGANWHRDGDFQVIGNPAS